MTCTAESPTRAGSGTQHIVRPSAWTLPEVRWALVALGLFALGSVAQALGMPTWLFWALYLACYVSGGWEPGLTG
ncbi:heavy metal translocating P-type ATPase, partial [Mycobacterium sp. ITM-2017-0098]